MSKRSFSALAFATFLACHGALAQFPGMTPAKHFPWSDKSLSPDARADMVIKEMTLDEKIQLLHGPGWQALFAPQESGPLTRAIAILGFHPRRSPPRNSRSPDDRFKPGCFDGRC